MAAAALAVLLDKVQQILQLLTTPAPSAPAEAVTLDSASSVVSNSARLSLVKYPSGVFKYIPYAASHTRLLLMSEQK